MVLAAALAARVVFLRSGVPHALGIDEPAAMDRALRILNTGDWNPHVFDYPTLVIYLHTLNALVCFLAGVVAGWWDSLPAFDIAAVYTAARLLTAVAGVLTVWITYRIGVAIGSRSLGLLAAAQLAVLPMHVRESHFALTDVPVTLFTTTGMLLAMRAARLRSASAYFVAGVGCGLAAAAKYNGAVALVAPAVVWLLYERAAPDRGRKAFALVAGAAVAFVAAVPFAVLDLPGFLSGFAAQAARFSGARFDGDPVWLLYLKHFALMGRLWLPAAAAGLVALLARRATRVAVAPVLAFGLAYYYVLATHPLVFARYALPLLPVISIFAAAAVLEIANASRRVRGGRYRRFVLAAGAIALTAAFTVETVRWLRQFHAPDTRQIATLWMKDNLPRGSRVVVENSGPNYLSRAGFVVTRLEMVTERPVEWYAARQIDYVIVTSRDPEITKPYLKAGPQVFAIGPTPSRWGPHVTIVKIR